MSDRVLGNGMPDSNFTCDLFFREEVVTGQLVGRLNMPFLNYISQYRRFMALNDD